MSSGPVSEIYRDSRGNEIALYADAPDQWGMCWTIFSLSRRGSAWKPVSKPIRNLDRGLAMLRERAKRYRWQEVQGVH